MVEVVAVTYDADRGITKIGDGAEKKNGTGAMRQSPCPFKVFG